MIKKIFGTSKAKDKYELNGQRLDNIDLSEVLTPGTYMLGSNITDNKKTGTTEASPNGNVLIVNGIDIGTYLRQTLIYGATIYTRSIYIDSETGEATTIDEWETHSIDSMDWTIDSLLKTVNGLHLKNSNLSFLGGSVEVSAGGSAYQDIAYPEGFNVGNTWVISQMASPSSGDAVYQSGQVGSNANSDGNVTAISLQTNPRVDLRNDCIRVYCKNYNTSAAKTFEFKVVIFKIDNVG